MQRFLITGARSWENPRPIVVVLERLLRSREADDLLLITGGAPGVDTIATTEASLLGIHVAMVPALWGSRGRSAGPRRNAVMLALEPAFVIAFHWNLDDSKGTANCVQQARRSGIPVKVVLRPREEAMPSLADWKRARAAKKAKR